MAIYRKGIRRTANVTFAIEAENMEEAQKIFDQWCIDDADKECKLSDTLAEREEDHEYWIGKYKNEDEYNMKGISDDFRISKSKEPIYDLYVKFDIIVKTYLGINMARLTDKLNEFNKDYILRPEFPSVEVVQQARKCKSSVLYFVAERRTK